MAAGVAAVVVSVGLGVGSGTAGAAPAPLSQVVVARTLPGFSLLPNKLYDGPISKATLDRYSNQAQWQSDVADGRLSGFVRAWSRTYQRGIALVYLSAVRMPDAAYAPEFASAIGTFASTQPGATTFAVSGVAGATGYRTSPPQEIGSATGYWIIFTRGSTGFFVYGVGPPRTLTAAQVTSVARQQAAHGSGG